MNHRIDNLGEYAKKGHTPWNKGIKGEYSVNKLENNPKWKGDQASYDSGRGRARRTIDISNSTCDICYKKATEIHHKNGNPLDNNLDNLMILCRRCHMVEDGRLVKLIDYIKTNGQKNNGGWLVCSNCGKKYRDKFNRSFILNGGMCSSCDHVRGEVTDDLHDEANEDKWATDAYLEGSFEEGDR